MIVRFFTKACVRTSVKYSTWRRLGQRDSCYGLSARPIYSIAARNCSNPWLLTFRDPSFFWRWWRRSLRISADSALRRPTPPKTNMILRQGFNIASYVKSSLLTDETRPGHIHNVCNHGRNLFGRTRRWRRHRCLDWASFQQLRGCLHVGLSMVP